MSAEAVLDVISAVFLLIGGSFVVLGGIGMLTFPDLLSRLHAAAKPQALGITLVLLGVAPQFDTWAAATPLLFVIVVLLITAPIVAGTIGRLAHHSGQYRPELLVTDELSATDQAANDR